MKQYIIKKEQKNIRIDKLISELEKDLSRSSIQRMIEEGNILVNGKKVKSSYKVEEDNVITIKKEEPKEVDVLPEDIPLNIIYEDKDIIIINKKKGMVVHPGNGNPNGTLVNAIMSKCKGSLSGIGGKIRPGIVHRIDKDTSGLVIVAKNDKAHINISNQIKNREVEKIYIALVRGVIKENKATINMPIARSNTDRKKMAVNKDGKEAISEFEVIKRYHGYTLVKVKIKTGRTHQIRVHMSEIGYPIVGDTVYSNGKNPFGVTRTNVTRIFLRIYTPYNKRKGKIRSTIARIF